MKQLSTLPQFERRFPRGVRAPKSPKTSVNVPIYGRRDPRGPDNNLRVWLDADGRLHLRLEKTNRCYQFSEIINTQGAVEIIMI